MFKQSPMYLLVAVCVFLCSGCFSESVSADLGGVSSSENSSDQGSADDSASSDQVNSDNSSSSDGAQAADQASSYQENDVSSSQVSYDGGSKDDTDHSSNDSDDWGFEADMESVETMRVDVLYRDASGSMLLDADDEPIIAIDTLVEYVSVPFYLDYRLIGEGWMGAGETGLMTIQRDCEAGPVENNGGYIEDTDALEGGDTYTPHTDLCKHYVVTPDFDDESEMNNWGGVAWLWKSNWGQNRDALMRIGPGATKISFWAKSNRDTKTIYNDTDDLWGRWFIEEPENSNATYEHNHSITIAVCGDNRGSCDWKPSALEFVVQLSGKWQYFELPLSKETVFDYMNMSTFTSDTAFVIDSDYPHLVSTGFMWTNAFNDIPGDDALDFFIDRIRYSDEPLYGGTPGDYETTVSKMKHKILRNSWGEE